MSSDKKAFETFFSNALPIVVLLIILALVISFVFLFVPDSAGIIKYTTDEKLTEDPGYEYALRAVSKLKNDGAEKIDEIWYISFDNIPIDDIIYQSYRTDIMIKYTIHGVSQTSYFRTAYYRDTSTQRPGNLTSGWVLKDVSIQRDDYLISKRMSYISYLSPIPFGFHEREFRYDTACIKFIWERA